jgi:hypothetical protein
MTHKAKPLIYQHLNAGAFEEHWKATNLGEYRVTIHPRRDHVGKLRCYCVVFGTGITGEHPTLEAAKQAAQDHADMLLAALIETQS